jgi:hypothetical protein
MVPKMTGFAQLIVCICTMTVLGGALPCFAGGTSKIRIINNCPITLWVHLTEMPAVNRINGGRAARLLPGATVSYNNVAPFGGGRCWAYYQDPGDKSSYVAPLNAHNGFVEMTVEPHAMNYNISLVDYTTLPVAVQGVRPDGSNCAATTLPWRFIDWKQKLLSCPTELDNYVDSLGIGRCLSGYFYCVKDDNATTKEFCYKMHEAHPAYTALAIYGGNFPEIGGWLIYDSCAAWHRGTFAGNTDTSQYYQGPEKVDGKWVNPYNTYAKWVHKDLGADVYAFANDDHQDHGGFVRCENCDELDITWCPCEKEADVIAHFPIVRLQQEKFIRYQIIAPNGRLLHSGEVSSLEAVSLAVRNRLPRGIYLIALYGRDGLLAAKKTLYLSH